MRISDWSSDVCSSDLLSGGRVGLYPSCFACRDLLGVPLGRLVQLDPERSSYYVKRMNSLRIPCRTHEWLGGLFERRSEEHTSELQSLMRISYAVFCLKKKKTTTTIHTIITTFYTYNLR